MKMHIKGACITLMMLGACGPTNPFDVDEDGEAVEEPTEEETPPVTGIYGDSPPPGTPEPTPTSGVVRSEINDGEGSGVASGFQYNAGSDTFFVDNLGFDGQNTYTRDDQVPTLQDGPNGTYALYENEETVIDELNGQPITQFTHKALYGVSPNTNAQGEPTVSFAIVRTGAYIEYGFGGFVYQRSTGANLPSVADLPATDTTPRGQARYSGDYAGLRDFGGRSGLEYVTGDMQVDVDFNDTNANYAVKGNITNRRIYDTANNDVTFPYLDALGTVYENTYTVMPTVRFTLTENGNLDVAGEATGNLQSIITNGDGANVALEQGNYYALIGGNTGREMVGIVVLESEDPRVEGTQVRETGGFILVR